MPGLQKRSLHSPLLLKHEAHPNRKADIGQYSCYSREIFRHVWFNITCRFRRSFYCKMKEYALSQGYSALQGWPFIRCRSPESTLVHTRLKLTGDSH